MSNRNRNASRSSSFKPTCRNVFCKSASSRWVDILALINMSHNNGWSGGASVHAFIDAVGRWMGSNTCIEHHSHLVCRGIFFNHRFVWHVEGTFASRALFGLFNDSVFQLFMHNFLVFIFELLILFQLPVYIVESLPTGFFIVFDNTAPGIHGTATSYLPSSFLVMLSCNSA